MNPVLLGKARVLGLDGRHKFQTFLIGGAIITVLIITFLLGRFSLAYQMSRNKPEIKVIPEINCGILSNADWKANPGPQPQYLHLTNPDFLSKIHSF